MSKKMSKKMKRNVFILILMIVGLIAMACYTVLIKPNMEKEIVTYQENTAQKGTLQSGVTESGSVSLGLTTQEYDLDISTEDDDDDEEDEDEDIKYLQVEEVYAAVGQRIQAGDPVYKFSQESIEAVRKALTYEQVEAKLAFTQAQAESEVGTITASLSKEEKELAYALAQQTYQVELAKIAQESSEKLLQIEQLLADIQDTQTALVEDDYREQMSDLAEAYEEAQTDYQEVTEGAYAFTKHLEAIEALHQAKDSYDQFMEQYDNSNETIQENLEKITKIQQEIMQDNQLMEKMILQASQTLESANVSGSIAAEKYQYDLKSYTSTVKKAQESLEEAEEKLQAFEDFIGDGIVYALGEGMITEMGYEKDDYLIHAGVLFSFAGENDKTISVDVSEEDVVSIQVGDTVNISFTAYPDEIYEGTVKEITTTATSRSTATVSYPVVIAIKGDTQKLFGGMTADVTFVTEEVADAVYVPRKAIVEQNQKKYLYKKSGEQYYLEEVTTGFSDGEHVQIISGLEEGEQYYIQTVVKEATEEIEKEDATNEANA